MAVNRFLQPSVYQYESQFVPTQIPFDMIAKAGAGKQQQQDLIKAKEQTLLDLAPAGIEELVYQPTGQRKRLGEKTQSQQLINEFNQKVIDLSNKPIDRMSSDYVREITGLRKEYGQLKGVLNILKQREDKYKGLQSEFGKAKDINKAQWLASPYLDEVLKLGESSSYIPQESINYGSYVDRIDNMQKAISKIRANKSAWASEKEGYINKGTLTKLGEEKLAKVAKEVLNEQGLIPDIISQVDYSIKLGKVNPEDREKEIEKYANNLVKYAMDHAYQEATADKTSDATYRWAKDKEDELNASLIPALTMQTDKGSVENSMANYFYNLSPTMDKRMADIQAKLNSTNVKHLDRQKLQNELDQLQVGRLKALEQKADMESRYPESFGKAVDPKIKKAQDSILSFLKDNSKSLGSKIQVSGKEYTKEFLNSSTLEQGLQNWQVLLKNQTKNAASDAIQKYFSDLPDERTELSISVAGKDPRVQAIKNMVASADPNSTFHVTDKEGNKIPASSIDLTQMDKASATFRFTKNANGNIEVWMPIKKTYDINPEEAKLQAGMEQMGVEYKPKGRAIYEPVKVEFAPNSWVGMSVLNDVASNKSLPENYRQEALKELTKQKTSNLYNFEQDFYNNTVQGGSSIYKTYINTPNEKGVPFSSPVYIKATKAPSADQRNYYTVNILDKNNQLVPLEQMGGEGEFSDMSHLISQMSQLGIVLK